MRTAKIIMVALIGALASPALGARDMCKMLKDKGILNEVEYNECKASQEKEEASLTSSFQDFAKNWIQYKEGTGFIINSSSTAPGDYRNPAPKPRFSFALGNRIQARYTFLSPDSVNADESSSFRIRRFKTFMNGNAFYPWLKYKTQVNWTGFTEQDARTNEPDLEDAIIDIAYFPAFSLQAGQYKVPFDRQELTSSGAQQFVDRAITNSRFTFSRDQGVMLHGVVGAEKEEWFEYSAGIFNGNGRNRSDNDNPEHLGVARLYWTPMGPFKYSESDTDNTPRPAVALGTAYAFNPVRATSTTTAAITTAIPDPTDPLDTIAVQTGSKTTTTRNDADIHRATVDAHFKWRGLSLLSDYFFESRDDKSPQTTTTELDLGGKPVGPSVTSSGRAGVVHAHGVLVQAGYFVIPKTIELAARFATLNPERRDNKQEEYRGVINWFVWAHNLKLQTDFGAVVRQVRNARDTRDFEARMQGQLIF